MLWRDFIPELHQAQVPDENDAHFRRLVLELQQARVELRPADA